MEIRQPSIAIVTKLIKVIMKLMIKYKVTYKLDTELHMQKISAVILNFRLNSHLILKYMIVFCKILNLHSTAWSEKKILSINVFRNVKGKIPHYQLTHT